MGCVGRRLRTLPPPDVTAIRDFSSLTVGTTRLQPTAAVPVASPRGSLTLGVPSSRLATVKVASYRLWDALNRRRRRPCCRGPPPSSLLALLCSRQHPAFRTVQDGKGQSAQCSHVPSSSRSHVPEPSHHSGHREAGLCLSQLTDQWLESGR